MCSGNGCTKLVTASEIKAKYYKEYCCTGMFTGCTSLKVAPKFTVDEADEGCCQSMFAGCSALEELPVTLCATQNWSYKQMFYNCSRLKIGQVASGEDIPSGGTLLLNCSGTNVNIGSDMFGNTCGTFKGTPSSGYQYYWYK